jgi:hypothetical protein
MTSEFLKRKKSSNLEKTGQDKEKPTLELDIVLELFTNILRKEEGEKCTCTNKLPEQIDNKNSFYETEVVPGMEFNSTPEGKVRLSEVINLLKQCGYPLIGSMISVYMKDTEEYVFMGSEPVDSAITLDETHIQNKILKLRAISYIEEKYINFNYLEKKNNSTLRLSRKESDKQKSKRTKERKIGYIIEKVNTWRKYYNGFYDEEGKFTKYSLDEAAKLIGISKKSLDDYLLQLRLGRKYGFDFNSNKNAKVGVLRSFVKQHRYAKEENS